MVDPKFLSFFLPMNKKHPIVVPTFQPPPPRGSEVEHKLNWQHVKDLFTTRKWLTAPKSLMYEVDTLLIPPMLSCLRAQKTKYHQIGAPIATLDYTKPIFQLSLCMQWNWCGWHLHGSILVTLEAVLIEKINVHHTNLKMDTSVVYYTTLKWI